ncbi:hypothetical protein WJX84_009272 [Apatococcus fuscideae]|uniref:Uncharacterized protein n=1 Tax=Apatococcus fuscideae TaxID=2026836 RepID=A0AAW1TEK5_9CHLO
MQATFQGNVEEVTHELVGLVANEITSDWNQFTDPAQCLAALRQGSPRQAVEYADLALKRYKMQCPNAHTKAKALYRKGAALIAWEQPELAVATLQQAVQLSDGSLSISAALQEALQRVSSGWLAEHWSTLIEDAEKPAALSRRDGRLLRRIPAPANLDRSQLANALQRALASHQDLQSHAGKLLATAGGKKPGRGPVTLMRGFAYLAAGNAEQAVKDARTAQAYGPAADGQSSWPEAWALLARGLERQEDYTAAGLAAAQAQRLAGSSQEFQEDVERIMRRMPTGHADALEEGGVEGLSRQLAVEKEEAKPEFLKKRPKYYYYYRWMKERITEHCQELPAPVMDKLLTMDAGELDLLLQHETAIKSKAQHLEEVLQDEGAKFLETYPVPMLTWEEVKALKGPGLVGLGAPGGAPIGASDVPSRTNMLQGIPDNDFEVLEDRSGARLIEAKTDYEDLEAIE